MCPGWWGGNENGMLVQKQIIKNTNVYVKENKKVLSILSFLVFCFPQHFTEAHVYYR